MEWFYSKDGERIGPVKADDIRTLILDKTLGPDDLVWNKTMGETWSKLSDVYIFAVHFKKPNATNDAEFARRLAESRAKQARDSAAMKMKLGIAAALIVILCIGGYAWNLSAEVRERGISETKPLGTLSDFESILIGTFKMDKQAAAATPNLPQSTYPATYYSNPKAGLGDHVNAGGAITLFANNDQITQLYAEFMSPGNRGPLLIDKSITSIEILTLWKILTGTEDRSLTYMSEAPEGTATKFGLTRFPGEGTYATFENSTISVIWVEYGQFCAHALLLARLK